jgi:hypothetical protein
MRSRRGLTAHEVARHTRDEVRRAERSAPHEYTTAQLRTTTPGPTPARPREKMLLSRKLVPGRDCLGNQSRTFWAGGDAGAEGQRDRAQRVKY